MAAGPFAPPFDGETPTPPGGFHRTVRFDGPPQADAAAFEDEIVLPRAPVMSDPRYVPRVAEILRDLADALAFAHDAGVVHRDLKPENVVLRPDGRAVLIDFGLAKSLAHTATSSAGSLVGTPGYMAPEQLGSRTAGAASDQYALGIVGYELLARALPFRGESIESLIGQVLHREVPPIRSRNPAVPAALADVLHKATAKRPEVRYPTVAAMRDDLDRFLAGGRTSARPYRFRFNPAELLAARPPLLAAAGVANLMAGGAVGLFAFLFLVIGSPATPYLFCGFLALTFAGRQFGYGRRFARVAGWSIAAMAAAAGLTIFFVNVVTAEQFLILVTFCGMFLAVSAVTFAALLSRDVADWLRRMRREREAFAAEMVPRDGAF